MPTSDPRPHEHGIACAFGAPDCPAFAEPADRRRPLWRRLLIGPRPYPAYAPPVANLATPTMALDSLEHARDLTASELSIRSSTTVAGLHRWPGAPRHRAYLRHTHRHLFGVTAEVEVDHGDRATEFHDLGEWLDRELRLLGSEYPGTRLIDFGARSCEQLAEELARELARQDYIPVIVTVSEDGEHTGIWRTL